MSPRISGWTRHGESGKGWRRERDWTGWHTLLGAAAGVAITLAVALLVGALSLGPEVPDLTEDPQALEEQYAEDWQAAFEPARAVAYAERLQQLTETLDDPWADRFRTGWTDGRRQVIEAMHRAANEQRLSEFRPEWQVLARLERSSPPRQ